MNLISLNFWIFTFLFISSWNYLRPGVQRLYLVISFSLVFYLLQPSSNLWLITFISLVAHFCCLFLSNQTTHKLSSKFILIISFVAHLAPLIFYKFFYKKLNLIIPAGISFIVFQSMAYVIDTAKNVQPFKHNFKNYFSFLMLFPQLIAGPICRAKDIVPALLQDTSKINFNSNAILKISWGMFIKTVIADNLAILVNQNLNPNLPLHGIEYFLTFTAYALQIYFDFHGYSLIAIGICEIINIKLPLNFNNPYFALSIKDFWRRWHISLSSWFKDYVYLPLGGSKMITFRSIMAAIITFTLSGIWHGPTLNFLIWGLIHALIYIIEKILAVDYVNVQSRLLYYILTIKTFFIIILTWVYFKIPDITQCNLITSKIINSFLLLDFKIENLHQDFFVLLLISFFAYIIDSLQLSKLTSSKLKYAISVLYIIAAIILRTGNKQFIYYQF